MYKPIHLWSNFRSDIWHTLYVGTVLMLKWKVSKLIRFEKWGYSIVSHVLFINVLMHCCNVFTCSLWNISKTYLIVAFQAKWRKLYATSMQCKQIGWICTDWYFIFDLSLWVVVGFELSYSHCEYFYIYLCFVSIAFMIVSNWFVSI